MKAKLCAMLFVLACSSSAFATPIVTIDPSTTSVTAGGAFSVDIVITGAENLFAFQFDLGFDPSKLAAVETTEGDFLSSVDTTFFIGGTVDNVGGTLTFTSNSLLGAIPGVTGNGILAHATFTALAATSPTTPINLFNVILLDDQLGEIAGVETRGGTVTIAANTDVTPVPEPGTVLLVGGGLAAAWRRRRVKV